MNRFAIRLVAISVAMITSQAANSQSAAGTTSDEIKSVLVPNA